jgi:HK97 family phage portal protein
MGLFSGRPPERRYNGFTAQFSNPPIPPNSAAASPAPMSLARAETSLQKLAVWAAVMLIANLAAELPIGVFTGDPAASEWAKPVKAPGYFQDIAGDGYGTPDWVFSALISYLLRGNVYGKVVERDGRGAFPTQVPLYHPDLVRGWRDADGRPTWRVNGLEVDAASMWHRRAYVLPGGLLGLSPVGYHAGTIGLGLAAQRFGQEFFEDGANPTGLLSNTEMDINKDIAQTAKERFVAAMNGRREPVVLGKGWKWEQISIAPEESQFLETQKYTSAECARIYGPGMPEILGYETGGSMTYQNVEQRNLHLLIYSIDPWLSRLERALTGMLPRPRFAQFDRRGLLRTDLLTRYKSHAIAIASRFVAPSEVRTGENMAPMTPEQLDELKFVPLPLLQPETVTPPTK